MSNWYAYKVLAETYDTDHRALADRTRRARAARRSERASRPAPVANPRSARYATDATPSPRPAVAGVRPAASSRWSAIAARLRFRRPVVAAGSEARRSAEVPASASAPC